MSSYYHCDLRVDAGLYDEDGVPRGDNYLDVPAAAAPLESNYTASLVVSNDNNAPPPATNYAASLVVSNGNYEAAATLALSAGGQSDAAAANNYGYVAAEPAPSAAAPAAAPSPSAERDWHGEFLTLLQTNDARQLELFVEEFSGAAERVAREIIEDRHKLFGRRHRPIDAGGVAGGVKYVVDGIFFKLAVDEHGLYGSDQLAGKVAKREILSTNFLLGARQALLEKHPELACVFFPLLCCVTYCGVSLLCSTKLPISRATLVYGSCDAGRTVHCDDEQLNAALATLAKHLNLRPHVCAQGKTLVFGTDVEGHRGTDGNYYVLDTSRTFPCEPITTQSPKGAFLYRLMRPELVARSAAPLSSDCFSRFALADPEWRARNDEARAAHALLHTRLLPAFRDRLRARPLPDNRRLFVSALHAFGINVRCLAALHALCDRDDAVDAALRDFLLTEMAARACKNLVRERVAAGGGPGQPGALHRAALLPLWGAEDGWQPVAAHAQAAFPGLRATAAQLHALRRAVLPRALDLLCVHGDPAQPHLAVRAKVSYLYSFKFNVATTFFEELKHVVDLQSIAVIQENLLRFYEALSAFSASAAMWDDLGVAAVEIVRRLHGAQLHEAQRERVQQMLALADEAFELALELRGLDEGPHSALHREGTLLNQAAAARYHAELLGSAAHWDAMHGLVRRVLAGTGSVRSRHMAAFFLAAQGRATAQRALVEEACAMLEAVAEPDAGPHLLYDLGTMHFWLGHADQAADAFRRVAQGPDAGHRVGALYMQAVLHANGGRWADARPLLQQALAADQRFYKAHALLAQCEYEEGRAAMQPQQRYDRLRQVLAHVAQAQTTSTMGGLTALYKGKALREMAQLGDRRPQLQREALDALRAATAERPRDGEALVLRALQAWDVAQLSSHGCDECQQPIAGVRWHCAQCGNYDRCEPCQAAVAPHEHALARHDDALPLQQECEAQACAGLACAGGPPSDQLPAYAGCGLAGVATQALDVMQRLAVWPAWAARLLAQAEPATLQRCVAEPASAGVRRYAALFLANCAAVEELRPALTTHYAVACCTALGASQDAVCLDALGRYFANLLLQDPNGRNALFRLVPHLRQALQGVQIAAPLVQAAIGYLDE